MQELKSSAKRRFAAAAVSAVALSALIAPAHALPVRVTVTNTQNAGGLSLTPLYFGFHDGSVDLFDVGSAASPGVEEIAETGDFGPLRDERLAIQSTSAGGAAAAPGGAVAGPIEPGETATFDVDLDPTLNRYAFFASMIVPSNDTFIGVDDPTAFALFDDAGVFAPQTISVTSGFAYDAGTEVNDPANGPAFVQGQDIAAGEAENGVIAPASSLADFVGLLLAGGLTLDPNEIDFIGDPNFEFAQITFSEVPLPPAALLMGAGLAGLAGAARRRKRA